MGSGHRKGHFQGTGIGFCLVTFRVKEVIHHMKLPVPAFSIGFALVVSIGAFGKALA